MRLRGMDQAEAGDQNNVQSRLDHMCPEVHDALNDALRWSWLRIGYGLVERSGFNNTQNLFYWQRLRSRGLDLGGFR